MCYWSSNGCDLPQKFKKRLRCRWNMVKCPLGSFNTRENMTKGHLCCLYIEKPWRSILLDAPTLDRIWWSALRGILLVEETRRTNGEASTGRRAVSAAGATSPDRLPLCVRSLSGSNRISEMKMDPDSPYMNRETLLLSIIYVCVLMLWQYCCCNIQQRLNSSFEYTSTHLNKQNSSP